MAAGGWQPDNTRELVMRIVGPVSWAQFSDASTTLPGQQPISAPIGPLGRGGGASTNQRAASV